MGFVLLVGGTGTLAVYALAREDTYLHARSAAQLALSIREGRASVGPFGAFAYGAPTDDVEKAIMTGAPRTWNGSTTGTRRLPVVDSRASAGPQQRCGGPHGIDGHGRGGRPARRVAPPAGPNRGAHHPLPGTGPGGASARGAR